MPASHIDVCIIAFGAPDAAAATAAAFSDVARTVRVVSTSPNAAEIADLPLENVGYGVAANAAFSATGDDGDWFVVLNDDIDIDTAGAHALAAQLDELNETTALWSFTGASTGIAPRREHHRAETPPHGAALAIRPTVFRSLGGFDARHFLYGEEVDLWLRLPATYVSGHELAPFVAHAGAASSRSKRSASFELGRGTGLVNRRHRNALRAAGRVTLRTAHVAVRRRRPAHAVAYLAGFVHAMLFPGSDGPGARRLGAAPRAERHRVGVVA